MRTLLFALVFICPPFLKKPLLRWCGGARIGRHVHLGWFSSVMGKAIAIGDYSEIRALTLIRCEGEVSIGAYSIISNFVLIYGAASLILGKHCYIGPQCLLNADEEIKIGDVSALGPRCMVFTHGSFLPYTEGYWAKLAGVTIGNKVWIAAGVFIHPGVAVGDEVFVNSKSVLTHNVPAGQAVEGFPARPVADMGKLKRSMTPARADSAVRHMLQQFAEMRLRRSLGITVHAENIDRMRLRYRGGEYLLLCVPSTGANGSRDEFSSGQRVIFFVNRQDWTPPATVENPMVFDLRTMRTTYSRDRIHLELWQYMRMYFGVTFEYQ